MKPGYTGARVALAQILGKSGDSDGALIELREASKADPQNFSGRSRSAIWNRREGGSRRLAGLHGCCGSAGSFGTQAGEPET